MYSACCDFMFEDRLQECTDKYAYCSNKDTQLIYKEFTAPPFSCDGTGDTQAVTHTMMNDPKQTIISWGMWDAGLLCRVIF